ncbi:Gfo/Idh/MocA family protein [Lacticaseibacillus saniviri]
MLRLGVIGTNWITAQFIDAAYKQEAYQLNAIYSRHEATAQALADKVGVKATIYTDLDAFFASDLDVVYIASPNSLHAPQTIQALAAGKHVIVEKPLAVNLKQLAAVNEAVQAHPDLMVFEAARHIYDANFKRINEFVATNDVSGATLSYMKYSSRYDAVLAGETPNVFSRQFGGGALMDLGIYLVYAAVAWFGVPNRATYQAKMLNTGVDGDGVMRLSYPDFDVTLITGKTKNSELTSEIYVGRDTLAFDQVGEIHHLTLKTETETTDLSQPIFDNPMEAEAKAFAEAIETNDREAFKKAWTLANSVHQVMGQLRQSAGLHFDTK